MRGRSRARARTRSGRRRAIFGVNRGRIVSEYATVWHGWDSGEIGGENRGTAAFHMKTGESVLKD